MAKHEAGGGRHAKAPDAPKAPRPKNKKTRRIIAAVLIGALVLGGAGGGSYYYLRHRSGTAVNVFPAEQLGTADSWYDRVQTGGQVRADKMQSVYVSTTQTVTEVYVHEGQKVKAGDPLLAFDTTLDEVELSRKKIDIEQKNLELKQAQEELKKIDTYKIGSGGGGGYIPPKVTATPKPPEATAVPLFQHGSGTADDPFVFLWDEDAFILEGTVDYLLDMAFGFDVPEVTTGPDVPLDPDQTPPEPSEGSSSPGPEAAEAALSLSGEPVPIGMSQTMAVRRLLAPAAAFRPLREEATISEAATDTPAPTEETPAEATATAEPAGNTPAPAEETPAPTEKDRFEGMDAQAILKAFDDLKEDAAALKAFYEELTQKEKQTVADTLSAEEMAGLISLLKEAGVETPAFPPASGAANGQQTEQQKKPSGQKNAQEESEQPPEETPPEEEATPSPSPSAIPVGATYYMVFEVRENNSMQGQVRWAFEVQFTLKELEWQRMWTFRVLPLSYVPQAGEPAETGDSGSFWFDSNIYYSAEEIAQMRAEAQRKITDLKLQLKKAEQELKQVEYELSNGQVLCTTDGVVKAVLDPEEAQEQNEPMIRVSGGGGYFITGYMSEFDMDRMHVGDTVTVDNYMAGEEVEATITEISHYPTADKYPDYYVQSANNNTSKYPFTVEVDEDANLREGYYVNIYFSATGSPGADQGKGDSFYLQNAFIRTEGNRSYVYAAGADGLLEKRYVTTGGNIYGQLTEITGGLDVEKDYIAFPYGRSVKVGAKTVQQQDIGILYGY